MAKVRKAQQTSPGQAKYIETGISGVTRFGAISRVYEEFLKELQGPQGMKLLREQLDNCPITGAMMFAVQHLGRGTTFRVDATPNKANIDTVRAAAVAKRVEDTLFNDLDVTWPDFLSEALSMCGFGWSLHEMVFKRCQGMTPPPSIDAATGQPIQQTSPFVAPPLGSATAGYTGQGAQPSPFTPSRFNDGWIGLKSLGLRAQETIFMWEWDANSKATVMQQMAPPDYRIRRIPLGKCLHFKTSVAKGNPEGRSLIRNAVPSYIYAKNLRQIESIGAERDLAGYPVFKTLAPDPTKGIKAKDLWNSQDANATLQLQKLESMLRSIRRDEQEGLILPYWLDFSLVSAGGGRRQFDTNQIITRHEQRIAMSMLADFIMIGHDAVGSKSLASTKSSLFTRGLNSLLDTICAQINRVLIPMLLDFNGVPQEYAPTLEHGDVETVPIEALGAFVQQLAQAGMPMFPDPDLEEALRDAAKLPDTGVQDADAAMSDNQGLADTGAHPVAAAPKPPMGAGGGGAAGAGHPFGAKGAIGMAMRPAPTVKRVRKLIERNGHGRIVKVHNY